MIAFIFIFFGIFSLEPAHAYLDPSSGGMLLQILLGGMAGLVAIGKIYWHSLKNFFKRLFNLKTGSPK